MLIRGCDYHPGFQQIAFVDTEPGSAANGGWQGLWPDAEVRFARGRARKSLWCAVNHRCNDCASRSPQQGSLNK